MIKKENTSERRRLAEFVIYDKLIPTVILEVLKMLYAVNLNMIKMIQGIKWIPNGNKALENLIANQDGYYKLNNYFNALQSMIEEISTFSNKTLDKSELISVEQSLLMFYYTLQNENITQSENISQIKKIINVLENNIDFYQKDKEHNFHIPTIIENIKMGFCSFSTENSIIDFKSDLAKKDIVDIYRDWFNCYYSLYHLQNYLEQIITNQYVNDWENNVFSIKKIPSSAYYNEHVITGSHDVIVSFCEDISKYYTTSQRIISASLHNTKSRRTFRNRTFGFMYSFSPDIIISMSPSDAEVSIEQHSNTVPNIFKLLKDCIPMCENGKSLHLSTIYLKTMYDFETFKKETIKYNEILIKEGSVPYGMFIFREAIDIHGASVMSYCISHDLPLFICNIDGSLHYIPSEELYKRLKSSIVNSLSTQPL